MISLMYIQNLTTVDRLEDHLNKKTDGNERPMFTYCRNPETSRKLKSSESHNTHLAYAGSKPKNCDVSDKTW